MTCFLNDYAVQWWRCWLCAERWGLVVYCNIGFGCSEKNKRLQCKAKTHISERPYFFKTVSVSLFSLYGLLSIYIEMRLLHNNTYTLELKKKSKHKHKGFLCFVFLLLLYFRAMHTKSSQCQVGRVNGRERPKPGWHNRFNREIDVLSACNIKDSLSVSCQCVKWWTFCS